LKVGEIYWVNLDPPIGEEVKKRRLVVVLNGSHHKHLRLDIVILITAWSPYWEKNPLFFSLELNLKNRLQKKSVIDCFQVRAISHKRFAQKIGNISDDEIHLIKKSIVLILDIQPEHCE